jgi:phosphate:Na+ symporter
MGYMSDVIRSISPTDAGKIAVFHLFFNAVIALLYLPFIKLGVAAVKRLVPDPPLAEEPFGPRYLDDNLLETPVLAFAQAKREIIRVAGYACDLFKDALRMFERGAHVQEIMEDIENRDDKIDILDNAIRLYLAKLSRGQLSDEEAVLQSKLFNVAGNIEEIGDIVSKDLVLLARKKWNKNCFFSEDGWKELRTFHDRVLENFNITISAIASPYPEVVQKIIRHQQEIYDLEQEFKQRHINRLHDGMKDSLETSSIHLDVLSNLRRVNGQLTYIAKVVSEEKDQKG